MIAKPRGSIRADELLTTAEIRVRLDLGQAALRMARRNGLPIKKIGRRNYVLGEDVIAYFKQHAKPV